MIKIVVLSILAMLIIVYCQDRAFRRRRERVLVKRKLERAKTIKDLKKDLSLKDKQPPE